MTKHKMSSPSVVSTYAEFATALSKPVEVVKRGRQELSEPLKSVPKGQRRQLLSRIYGLCKRKVEIERNLKDETERANEIRQRLICHRKARAHIANAVNSLKKAGRATEEPYLIRDLEIDKAERILEDALGDAVWIEKQLMPVSIPADLRTHLEARDLDPHIVGSLFDPGVSGFRSTKVNYWFIGETEKVLNQYVTADKESISKAERDRIISKVFEAAFQQSGWPPSRVKTARQRIAQRQAS